MKTSRRPLMEHLKRQSGLQSEILDMRRRVSNIERAPVRLTPSQPVPTRKAGITAATPAAASGLADVFLNYSADPLSSVIEGFSAAVALLNSVSTAALALADPTFFGFEPDADGNLWVWDSTASIQRLTSAGAVDMTLSPSGFINCTQVSIGQDGNIYVFGSKTGTDNWIQSYDSAGAPIAQWNPTAASGGSGGTGYIAADKGNPDQVYLLLPNGGTTHLHRYDSAGADTDLGSLGNSNTIFETLCCDENGDLFYQTFTGGAYTGPMGITKYGGSTFTIAEVHIMIGAALGYVYGLDSSTGAAFKYDYAGSVITSWLESGANFFLSWLALRFSA